MNYFGLKVYDMEEAIVASGFPKLKERVTPSEWEWEIENLKYWIETGAIEYMWHQEEIKKGLNTKDSCKYCGSNNHVQKYKGKDYYCSSCTHMLNKYGYIKENYRKNPNNKIELFDDRAEIITIRNDGMENGRFIIDHESVPSIMNYKWGLSHKYCIMSTTGIKLHRFLALDEQEIHNTKIVVDHIDKNTFNNKLSNLRITDNTNNVRNASLSKNNTSGIIGVNFRKDRNKWRAFIMVNKKQISLGLYECVDDAIKARLKAELKYFGEFSPQIELFEKYGIEVPKITTIKENTKQYNLNRAWKHFKRAIILGNCVPATGHDAMLKGILVNVNITADQSFWLQWERYHHQDTVSSMSTMHCLTKFTNLESMFNEYVDKRALDLLKEKIDEYNKCPTEDNFNKVIYNCPEGIELTRRVTTNYLQLKTMYNQRKHHKMKSWNEDFINMCNELPFFTLFTNANLK